MVSERKKENIVMWPYKQGLQKILGELEYAVMDIMWNQEEKCNVRDVYNILKKSRPKLAYTTIMTIMNNLEEKKLLIVDKNEFKYQYFAAGTKEEFTQKFIDSILTNLMADFTEPVLSHFFRFIDNVNVDELKKIKEKLKN